MIVAAVQHPNLKGHAGGVRTERVVISLDVHDALALLLILAYYVAEDAALPLAKPLACRIQFVLDSPGDKNRRGNLGMGVRPFISRKRALVLEDGHILESRVLLQIGDARPPHPEHAIDFFVA